MFLFLLLIILMSYFLDGKIFFVSIFLIMLVVQIVSDKQDLYLQQKFENINDEIEKPSRKLEAKKKELKMRKILFIGLLATSSLFGANGTNCDNLLKEADKYLSRVALCEVTAEKTCNYCTCIL